MSIHTTAYAIELFWGRADLVLAAADAISVAIPANAAFVGDWGNQAVLSLGAHKRHGRGIC